MAVCAPAPAGKAAGSGLELEVSVYAPEAASAAMFSRDGRLTLTIKQNEYEMQWAASSYVQRPSRLRPRTLSSHTHAPFGARMASPVSDGPEELIKNHERDCQSRMS